MASGSWVSRWAQRCRTHHGRHAMGPPGVPGAWVRALEEVKLIIARMQFRGGSASPWRKQRWRKKELQNGTWSAADNVGRQTTFSTSTAARNNGEVALAAGWARQPGRRAARGPGEVEHGTATAAEHGHLAAGVWSGLGENRVDRSAIWPFGDWIRWLEVRDDKWAQVSLGEWGGGWPANVVNLWWRWW
jgi:hypothetical protein